MSESPLGVEVRERVATLTLDNPPASTCSHAMVQQLDAHAVALRLDRAVDVIVLRGAGERLFCAGADIAMLAEADPCWKHVFCLLEARLSASQDARDGMAAFREKRPPRFAAERA
jgi:enoyl-CoA hydratase/carnithine racemase